MKKENAVLSLIFAISWTLYIFYRGSGKIFIGGDSAGYYDWRGLLVNLGHLPPLYLLPYIPLLITGNRIYIAYYLNIFMLSFIFFICLFYFIDVMFKDYDNLTLLKIVSATLYVLSPIGIIDTFKSAIGRTNAYFGLFLASIAKYTETVTEDRGPMDYLILGILMGLTMTAFPNCYRTLAVYILVFSVIALIMGKDVIEKLPRYIYTILAFLTLSFWMFKPVISLRFIHSVRAIARRRYYSSGLFGRLRHRYTRIVYVLRLIDYWGFFMGYAPYASSYLSSPVISVCSMLLPIAVFVPTLLKDLKRFERTYGSVLSLTSLLLISIAWETEANPPFSWLYVCVARYVPLIRAVLKQFVLTLLVMNCFYPVMAALGVVAISRIVKRLPWRLLVLSLLTVLLVIPAWPIINGSAFGQYFNESVKGIRIPKDYFVIKSYFDRYKGRFEAVIYPTMPLYIETSWYYQGTNRFYLKFFEPYRVIVPDTFGGYSLMVNSTLRNLYRDLTDPTVIAFVNGSRVILRLSEFNITNADYVNFTKNIWKLYKKFNVKYIIFDRSIRVKYASRYEKGLMTLERFKVIKCVYSGKYASLYRVPI